jgi:hypothetical protein
MTYSLLERSELITCLGLALHLQWSWVKPPVVGVLNRLDSLRSVLLHNEGSMDVVGKSLDEAHCTFLHKILGALPLYLFETYCEVFWPAFALLPYRPLPVFAQRRTPRAETEWEGVPLVITNQKAMTTHRKPVASAFRLGLEIQFQSLRYGSQDIPP